MDVKTVEKLVRVLSDSARLTEMEVRQGDITVRLRRPAPTPPVAKPSRASAPNHMPADLIPTPPTTTATVVTSEFVGVFHAPPQNTIAVGGVITKEQALGHIETMRLMNPVPAPVGGRLQGLFVQDNQPVEYGQPLFEIVPEDIK